MDQIIINVELTRDDWLAYQRAAQQHVNQQARHSSLVVTLSWLMVTIATLALLDWFDVEYSVASFLSGYFVMLGVMLLARRRTLKHYAPRDDGAFLGSSAYTLNEHGINIQRTGMSTHCSWRDVVAVTQDDRCVYFWIDTNAAFLLPTRHLPTDLPWPMLLTQLEQWRAANVSPAHMPQVAVTHAATPESTQPSSQQQHWLKTLAKLFLLRPVPADTVPANTAPIIWLALASLLLTISFDRLNAGAQSEFYANNIPVIGLYALVALTIAWLWSRESQPNLSFGKVLFVVAGGMTLLMVLLQAFRSVTGYPWALAGYLAIGLYFLAYGANALHRLSEAHQPRAMLTTVAIALLFSVASADNYWTAQLWYPPEDESADAEYGPTLNDSEVLLFEQQQRIDHALGDIAPAIGSTPSTYFLGFAGVAEQKVFAEEIRLAAQVVDDRYDTNKRSLRLVNDRRDLHSQPLATVTNLRYALQGLAKKMNVDQDVLFLALSSHGDDEPSLQVSNGFLSLQQVTGDNLAQALHDSGIKWRVIIISACHAGSFIEPLKDPHTIVITAAAADKTSFGCDDERDLTYFGEAFYRDALPAAANLEDAFAQAKAAIAAREQREKIKASDPQAYFGAEISRKLRQRLNVL